MPWRAWSNGDPTSTVSASDSSRPSDASRASNPPPTVSVALVIAIGVLSNSAVRSSPATDSGAIFSIGARLSPGSSHTTSSRAHREERAGDVVHLLEGAACLLARRQGVGIAARPCPR